VELASLATRTIRRTGILLLLSASLGCTPLAKMDLGSLVTSGRDGWQHPEQVIADLGLKQGDHVAEIGAGNGYWLSWLAAAVGPNGRVYAVEVEEEKVAKLRQKVNDEALDNVVVVFGDFADPKLPDGELDVAMTCLTYHHIEERESYFRNLQIDLAPGGRVAHLDDRPDAPAPFSWFQGKGHWSDPADIEYEMEQAGYRLEDSYDFLPVQSFQIFAPVPRLAAD
jgi:arsenite methyltransferase